MRRPITTAALLAAALAAAWGMAAAQNATGTSETEMIAVELAPTDMEFFRSAVAGGKAEVQLGELAAAQGHHPDVRRFGQRLAEDHAAANAELSRIAERKRLDEPADLAPDSKQLIERLSSLSGPEFDRQYLMEAVSDHETEIDLFEQQAQRGHDSELSKFAEATLPTLRKHLERAREIRIALDNIAGAQ